jgi:hypothetical protein
MQDGYSKVANADELDPAGAHGRSSFYRALAYGYGDEFARDVCTAIDREIEAKATSSIIAARQKAWIRHVGECAVHHKELK